MEKINSKVKQLKFSGIASVIEKANKIEGDVIRLEVGDVDLDSPEEIKKGIIESLENNKTHYPPLRGNGQLLEYIANDLNSEINKDVKVSNIIITPGGSMGMFYIFSTILKENDEVIVFEPLWPHLCEMIKYVGAIPIKIGLEEKNDFHIDFEILKDKISSKTRAILLNTPNNPTGIIFSEDEMVKLAKIAKENNLYIISDEEYCDYYYDDNKFVTPLKFYDKTLISRSYSKKYSIAGLRIGYVVAESEIIDEMSKLALFTNMYSSSIVQCAIESQYKNMEYFVENARKTMQERMDLLYEGFNKIKGLSCKKSEGGLYIWLKCSEIEEDDKKFADRLLYNAKVATVPGSCFGDSGKGYLRVSLGADKEKIKQAIERIEKEVNNG